MIIFSIIRVIILRIISSIVIVVIITWVGLPIDNNNNHHQKLEKGVAKGKARRHEAIAPAVAPVSGADESDRKTMKFAVNFEKKHYNNA